MRNLIRLVVKSIKSQGHQSVISIAGLMVALCCSVLILLYVKYELSYDLYHLNADSIYRIIVRQANSKTYMGKDIFSITPGPLKAALINDIPEIRYSTKCTLKPHTLEYNSELFTEKGILYADTDFVKIFTIKVLSGNPAVGLKEPFNLYISKDKALKYFGNNDPIGKIIKADNKYSYTVAGVFENIPFNSHFKFDFLTGIESFYKERGGGKQNAERWDSFNYTTYIMLAESVKPEIVEEKMKGFGKKYLSGFKMFDGIHWIIQPLKEIHLSGNSNFEIGRNSDIRYIYLISSIGILILLIACFNYMNMATARSFSRGREIGILKVLGSSRISLIKQFLTESVIFSFAGLVLATGLVYLLLPTFGQFLERPLSFMMIFKFSTLLKIVLLTILAGIFAGLYPAIHLSSLSPVQLIKEDFKNIGGRKKSSVNIRNLLVVIQYFLSLVALICTLTLIKQLNYIKRADLGFDKDNILTIYLNDPSIRGNTDFLLSELRKNPNIEDITVSTDLPYSITEASDCYWDGKDKNTHAQIFKSGIGSNFIDFYKLKIVSGRRFSDDFPSDIEKSIILNERTMKLVDWNDIENKKFGARQTNLRSVVGVIKDFNFQSLHLALEPLVLLPIGDPEFSEVRYISLRISPANFKGTILSVERTLKKLSPNFINPVSALSDKIDSMYTTDKRTGKILIFSSIIAILLTCFGLYSLSSYTMKERTKEMVIRKIMGSQPREIMMMVIRDFAKWILAAIFLALPTAYLLMDKWLENFAYRIRIGADVFISSIIITLLISLIVISYHVIKLSTVNPAERIRQE